ncbi:lipopolysaccharide export system permease protein [Ketogulonicigenium robustum]|uniref:Lipopolysaccharide export system permease protein n=1 Tax=Ketogulonicigenium robustum TaxID=92947 RepID=A0A1W6NZW7_9RHOB|nr:LPS export ABC transporter permease LptG [Ketogulonicigenium robustum]ARO14739.1 lipopolysaccharide export system permease protein [Ketogulonicigenium robustum]
MILHRYFAWRYLKAFLSTAAGFFLMLMMIELVEQLRRFGGQLDFGAIMQLTLLNVPGTFYTVLPLVVVISALMLFLGLARSSEMVVTRAAGRSAIIALVSPVVVVFLMGMLAVMGMNPIVAATSRQYDARIATLTGGGQVLQFSNGAIWLREGDADGQSVIRAGASDTDGTTFRDVTMISFDPQGHPYRRIAALDATLDSSGWLFHGVKVWPLGPDINSEAASEVSDMLRIPSSLTADQIRDSFGSPSSISVWELPTFIARMEASGFAARRHVVHLQSELAQPAFLVAMMLIAAVFTLRHQRGGHTGIMVLFAVLISFSLYFVRNLAQILGENGQIPPVMAAWVTPLAAIALGVGLLLHLEDG